MTKNKTPSPPTPLCGFAWYRAEEWPQLLAAAADRQDLEETHAEWLKNAQRTFLELSAQGMAVRKVDVRVDELIQWCRQNHRPLDSAARADYAGFKLLQSHKKA